MSGDMKLSKSELANYEKLKYKWKELSVEDIILDGLYLNCVRLVKEYAEKVLKIDLKVDRINNIGLKSVLQLLADKDLRGAEILLNHMNFDSNQKIFQICFFTLYKQLRDYLVSVLIDRKKLNENELEMVEYLKKLETVYPCRSFQLANDSIKEYGWKIDAKNSNKHFKQKELISFREGEEASTSQHQILYSHVVIEWIREWSSETKQEILADGLILNRDEMNTELQQLNPNVLLSVLLDQNDVKTLLEWIDFSFNSEPPSDDTNKVAIFKSQLNQEMVNFMKKNRKFLPECKELVLNYLANFNVLCDDELINTGLQLARLSKSNTLFNPNIFKLQDNEFHSKFILNFGKLLPANFVWSYLDMYNSLFEQNNLESILLTKEGTRAELKLLSLFRQQNRVDFIPQLSLVNLELINNKDSGLISKETKMSDLFDTAHKELHLVALALSLYTDNLMTSSQKEQLSHLLDEFPAIRLILNTGSLQQPISLYNLLQEHSKLDMTKCFNWQRLNSIDLFQDQVSKARASNSFSSSLLSFENEDFVKRFAYKDSFDFSYFVKKGRPFFAYQFFIRKQLNKFGKPNKTM